MWLIYPSFLVDRPTSLTNGALTGAKGRFSVESIPHGQPVRRAPRLGPGRGRRRRDGRPHHERSPSFALPRGGEPEGAGERRDPPHELHPCRRGPDRDQHVRREPAEAGAILPRGRARADQRRRGQARPRGARGLGPGGLHRRVDRAARRRPLAGGRPACRGLRRAGSDPRWPRHRPVHGRDVLRARRAGDRDRGRAQRLLAPHRRDADFRRGRRDAGRPAGRRRGRMPAPSEPRRHRRQPRLGPARGALGARGHELRRRPAARGVAERRPGEPLRWPRHLPARDARVLRRVRRARPAARRAPDRRLLRDDAGRDRGDPLRGRGGARAGSAAREPRARAPGGRPRRRARRDGAGADAARGRVGHLRGARSAEGRHLRLDARRSAHAQGLGQGRIRGHQRQPDGPRPRERAHGRGCHRARMRPRDDPAPDAARHVDHGPRVTASRRPRGGRAQRPLGDRRPARGRRLPGLAGRLRRRLDRALEDRLAPEPRRGLQRQGDRRADLVLPRRRGQPVGRRPRDRARPLPPEGRGRARSSR